MDLFPADECRFVLDGPAGGLEVVTAAPREKESGAGTVTIVCHPHSLMGGTLDNKVVHTVARARREQGQRTVRFNFRGVGTSAGVFDHGKGESDDLLAIIDWVRQVRPLDRLWLAGFSFGAYVAARTCARAVDRGDPVDQLLLIAPAVVNYDFEHLRTFPVPLTLIYGDADEVVDPLAIRHWFDQVDSPRQVICLPEAGHFFHGRLTELKARLQEMPHI